jgi:hypothetical protein
MEFSEEFFDSLWRADDLPATHDDLKMQNLKVKATGNPYLLAHLLSRTARCQSLLGRFEQAVETMNEADYVLLEAARRDAHEHPQKHRAWIRYMIERGRLFAETGWHSSAQNFLNDAILMARDLGHLDMVRELLEIHKKLEIDLPPSPATTSSTSEEPEAALAPD